MQLYTIPLLLFLEGPVHKCHVFVYSIHYRFTRDFGLVAGLETGDFAHVESLQEMGMTLSRSICAMEDLRRPVSKYLLGPGYLLQKEYG